MPALLVCIQNSTPWRPDRNIRVTLEMCVYIPSRCTVASMSYQQALRDILRPDQVLDDAESLERYSHDDAEWADFALPLAVVLAESTLDVSRVVTLAVASGVHVVA